MAAQAVRLSGFIPKFSSWEYELPQHFMESDRKELAIRIARGMVEKKPKNSRLITNLARLYRKAGEPKQATKVFQDFFMQTTSDRAYFYEWGGGGIEGG